VVYPKHTPDLTRISPSQKINNVTKVHRSHLQKGAVLELEKKRLAVMPSFILIFFIVIDLPTNLTSSFAIYFMFPFVLLKLPWWDMWERLSKFGCALCM
jgi:hypothetical protein